MFKGLSISIVVVLLLSYGTFADIGQVEGFSIGAGNVIERVGGAGWAEGGNTVMVAHGQEAYTVGMAAIQEETGVLTQSAGAGGVGGTTAVLQQASANGLQGQVIGSGRAGPREQGQNLTVSLDNIILKAGGIGGAIGAQGFVGGQNQILVTPSGTSANSQFVGAAQFAAVSGGPGSNLLVNNTLDVKMCQDQIVTGGCVPPKPPCDP